MRKRLNIPVLLALAALALVAGCGRGDNLALSSETDEPNYRMGQQLAKQGRTQEALSAYLKVIAKRSDSAPESHLEVGLIFMRHVKDPIAAIYHFQKYLELQPNSRQAVFVTAQIKAAKRDYIRTLAATPLEGQTERLEMQDLIDRLQRENDQLKAELVALRAGVSTAQPIRTRQDLDTAAADGPVISVPVSAPETASSPPPADESPVTYAPVESPVMAEPPPSIQRAPVGAPIRAVPTKPTSPSSRRHVVAKGDTLFSLAQKYYGNRSRWRDIFEANRDVLPSQDALRLGMEIKIP